MPGESYRRRLRSCTMYQVSGLCRHLYLCYVFRALINSLVCWFIICKSACVSKCQCVSVLICFVWLSVGGSVCLSVCLHTYQSLQLSLNRIILNFLHFINISFMTSTLLFFFFFYHSYSIQALETVHPPPPPSHHHTCPQNNNKIWAGEGMVFAGLTNGLPKYAKRHLASVGEVIGRCLQLCYFGKTSERPGSAYGLFWAHRYHLEVNLIEMSFVTAAKVSSVTRWGKH